MRRVRLHWRQLLRPLVRNKLVLAGSAMVVILMLLALLAHLISPSDPVATNSRETLQAPSAQHWFGTDRFGRDVLSRVLHGSRISLWVGIVSIAIAVAVGIILGLFSGYFGGWADHLISRAMDVVFSFPALLLAITMAAMLGSGLNNALLAIAIVYSPLFGRVVRGEVLAERQREYVEAARMIGARDARIIGLHIFPNVLSSIIVQGSVSVSNAILIEASLSYLGLGTRPPNPSWGTMLNEGRAVLETAPWTSVFPGLAIMLAVLAFNLLGDGLRDVLDPRLRSA